MTSSALFLGNLFHIYSDSDGADDWMLTAPNLSPEYCLQGSPLQSSPCDVNAVMLSVEFNLTVKFRLRSVRFCDCVAPLKLAP